MLELSNISSGYKFEIIHNLDINFQRGKITSIIGPNGAGKTTLLKTIFNLTSLCTGSINYNKQSIIGLNPKSLIELGIVLVPQYNSFFEDLTVLENLKISILKDNSNNIKNFLDEYSNIFPIIEEKKNTKAKLLSGGEKQMLSICLGLIKKPKLILLDEPSLGLQPSSIKNIFQKLSQIHKVNDVDIIIVEQKVRQVLEIADVVIGLKLGKLVLNKITNQITDLDLKELFI